LDRVVEACGLDGARVLELLTALELAGLAERSAGGFSKHLPQAGHLAEARR
jgi:predicted Rossmann fold nucleotide-binding protein DprA/Smf involved in DNA uptake